MLCSGSLTWQSEVVSTGQDSFWGRLAPADRKAIEEVSARRRYAAGDYLCHEGDQTKHVIVVLSGHVQEEQSERVLTSAHQFLSKPCSEQQLENMIDRCMTLHQMLAEPRLRDVVGRVKKLPTIPTAFVRLNKLINDPDVCIGKVADAVSADPAIAAKVLQMVNSSFFRLGRRISRIEQAVNYLGLTAIRNVVLSVEVFSAWPARPDLPDFTPERLQARAQQVAAEAWALTQRTPIADDALLAGLLHNIGYWVLLQECSKEVARAADIARTQSIPLAVAERELIGASHAEVGAYLLGLWGLPRPVVEAVAFQHAPAAQVAHSEFDVLTALQEAQRRVTEIGEPA